MKKKLLLLILSLICLSENYAQKPLWQNKGRIVISSDGNEHDDDDWAATSFSLAIIAAKGLQNKLSLYIYCDHVWGSNVAHPNKFGLSAYEQMKRSALGAKEYFNFNKTNFICAVDNPEVAYEALKNEINKSSKNNPLIIVAAGPMQVVGEAINRSDIKKRKYVKVLSHSIWNNEHSNKPNTKWENHHGWTWNMMVEQFGNEKSNVSFIQILDQNGGDDYLGFCCAKKYFNWIRTSSARDDGYYKPGAWDFLYERLNSCQKNNNKDFDPSDAGMIVYMLTGTEKTNPEMARKIMEEHVNDF